MRRIFVISSYVAQGTVGLQATLPALPNAMFDVVAVPTVVLSNHPGFKACAGTALEPHILSAMVDALEANGWLNGLDAIFTGYLPSADHVQWARRTVERVKALNGSALYIADPVLGDDPGGLYVSGETADAVRDRLIPLADLVTPNSFELSWLTGLAVTCPATAMTAARALKRPRIAATSIPSGAANLANILVTPSETWTDSVARLAHAPHGTGDYFAGLLTAGLLSGQTDQAALSHATQTTANIIAASQNHDHLRFTD
ncbi:MAG: pyridoxal kinase [Hyphomicrobium sp.]|nr:pyridoxal kinase [Hyphomicrobium sp.]